MDYIVKNMDSYASSASEKGSEEECCIGWRNLRYEIKTKWCGTGTKKVILDRLNGCFEYHTLNAFMGPSGAGKTTLLNCLNGNRVKGLSEESEIFLNKDHQGKVVSYFIEQHVEKTIVGKMRVGHILRYAYRFKNGSEGDMEKHIQKTIDELLLDVRVLDRNFENCSGGEQKRIAIAQELMSLQKPTLLFVDEPTTGLDSNAAHLVMKCLKQLATNHRMTVITSIHVPSDDILTLFDKLYVLSKGGVCIYSGRPDQLSFHLETQIADYKIMKDQPPIEELIRIACNGTADSRVVTLSDQTLSAEYLNISQRLPEMDPYPNGVPNHRKCFSGWHLFRQTGRMFRITFVSNIRLFLFQLLAGASFQFLLSSMFSSDMVKPSGCNPLGVSQEDSLEDSENSTTSATCTHQIDSFSLLRQNIHFIGLMMFYMGMVIMSCGPVFYSPLVRVFQNEHRNQWYSLGVFFWSTTIVCLIQVSMFATFYGVFGYFASGQHFVDGYDINLYRIGNYLLFLWLLALYMDGLGQLIGTLFMNVDDISVVFAIFGYILISLYYGYFVDLEFSKDILIDFARKTLGLNSIFRGLLNCIYGEERCDWDVEFSLVQLNYHIDPEEVPHYPLQVLINIVLVRVVTFVYMYWKFNTFGSRTTCPPECELPAEYEIDTEELGQIKQDTNNNKILITKRVKSEEEIEFEKFSRGKIIVAWRDLSLFGTNLVFERAASESGNIDSKAILKNLNGEFRFGTLNALMGTSGAGKTSLLKVLNGRDKTRISAQSQFYLSKFTRIQTCFITQDVSGHLLPGLTAKQMLVYASRLKNAQLREVGVDTSKIDHQQVALNLLDELGLSDTVDTLVERCSGGERKRLALALELTALQMPNLICIDEPTSGLDSNSAEVVVACLRKLTQTHCITIVTSIHQPNTEVMLMFDQIYVLARGGVCVYSGAPTAILPHLHSVPEITSLNIKSPIETLIKHSCNSYPDPIVHQLMSNNHHQFAKSVLLSGVLSQETQPVMDGIQQNRRRFSLEDTWILCVRYWAYVRGHLWMEWAAYLVMYLGYATFMSILFNSEIAVPSGCISLDDDFNNTCTKSEEKLHEETLIHYNVQFNIFAFCYIFAFIVIQSGMSISRESIYFYNEHRNGWYSTGSFFLTKSLFDSVPVLLIMFAYCYICNIYQSIVPGIYPHLYLVMALGVIAYQSLAYLISVMIKGQMIILAITGTIVFLTNLLFSNLFAPLSSMHYIFLLLSNLSINRFYLDSLFILEYGFGRCLPKQIQPLLYLFSLHDSDYYRNLQILVLLAIAYRSLALLMLIYNSNSDRNRRHHIQRVTDHCSQLKPTETIFPGLGSPNEFRIRLIRLN